MTRKPVKLADLQAAFRDGHEREVASALLGRAVRVQRKPAALPPLPVVVPGERTRPSVTQCVDPLLTKPADWPWRILPEDLDRMVFEAATEELPARDRELVRYACGWASNATADHPRFPVVLSVVNRIRHEIMRDIGWAGDGMRLKPRASKETARPRTEARAGVCVRRDAFGDWLDPDGNVISEAEARALMAAPVPQD